MSKTKLMIGLGILTTVGLVGCGGSGSDATPTPTTAQSFSGNGIYINSNDFIVMAVDSKRTKNNLIVGDFNYGSVLIVDSATTSKNQMNTKGMTLADRNGFAFDPEQTMTASFVGSVGTLTAVIDNTNIVYSMDKTSASLPLDQIVGTHTNPSDGSTWTINADGSFSVNGICTISGNLKRNGDLFNIDKATAVSCSDASFNGDYHGVLMTVSRNGTQYVAGILGNDTALLWGNAVKS
ncbi:hypothetical protein ACQKP8_24405 [Photobacterium alginatilyticum]|uniref:hypothetical protein n=1 Tax=Photobacterium alginatilyticum TaxID=1775171 RepID=UPI0040678CA1